MHPTELKYQTIVYAALDWGYGHVTRSIGIIRELLAQENKLIIACNSEQEQLFRSYFPQLIYVHLPGYNLTFRGKANWGLDLFRQRQTFFNSIRNEYLFLDSLIKEHHIDCIISDHRYGFHHPKIPSVFVTHQVHLPISPLFFFIQKWHQKQLRKFNSLWILDSEDSALAGKLSRRISHPEILYIGWKSRFTFSKEQEKKYDYLIVISGPKPYSEQLLSEIQSKLDLKHKKVAILYPANLTFPTSKFDFYPAENLKTSDDLFLQSEIIISRSGYSTLMDLKILEKRGILLPTPGQKEQLYLATKLNGDTQFEFIFT